MINWSKLSYSQEELREAWVSAVFVNDAAETLGIDPTVPKMRTLKRIALTLDLDDKPIWTRDFTPVEFKHAWESSLTAKDAAQKLNTTTRGFETLRQILDLEEKTNLNTTYDKEQFIQIWESSKYLDDVADHLNVAKSQKSFGKLLKLAQTLGLSPKEKYIPTTDTGENAGDIIGNWIDWHETFFKVKPLPTTVGIAAAKTKELIGADYSEDSIKWGLWQWSLKAQQGEFTSGETLFKLVSYHHTKHNPEVEANIHMLKGLEAPSKHSKIEKRKPVIEAKQW